MGACLILAPAIVAGWPAITAAVAGAAAAMGLNMAKEIQEENARADAKVPNVKSIELDMEKSEVLESSIEMNQELTLQRDGMNIRIHRDERGQLRFHVDGKGRSEQELEEFGRQVVQKVTQTYIYNRVVTELKQRNIEVRQEEIAEDESVHIYVRNILE